MTELWFNNPKILLKNLDEFIPDKNLKFNNKINSIIRFAIYYSILIILLDYNINYLYFSLILIIISYYLGNYYIINEENKENFYNNSSSTVEECRNPTENNPFMNYTLGELIDNVNHSKACKYDDVKDDIRKKFRKDIYTDSSDLWGKYISDRNFYTMPNTEIVNDQNGFAEWLYGGHGTCKSTGFDCLKQRDSTYNRGRITTQVDDNVF
jgi:disulfide bond formation protein DsbB